VVWQFFWKRSHTGNSLYVREILVKYSNLAPIQNSAEGSGVCTSASLKSSMTTLVIGCVPPLKLNGSPLKRYRDPNRKVVFQPLFFRGELFNFRGVKICWFLWFFILCSSTIVQSSNSKWFSMVLWLAIQVVFWHSSDRWYRVMSGSRHVRPSQVYLDSLQWMSWRSHFIWARVDQTPYIGDGHPTGK